MKKFNEILAEINAVYEQTEAIENRINGLYDGCNSENRNKRLNLAAGLDKEVTDLRLTLLYLKNNAKIALFNEIFPIVLEVLGKYENKALGPKTERKVRDEIKERTNCLVWINQEIQIVYLSEKGCRTEYGFTCSTKMIDGNQKRILIDNKIQKLDFADFELLYINENYVEDISAVIDEIKRLKTEAKAKQAKLRKICDEYNELVVDGISNIYYDSRL